MLFSKKHLAWIIIGGTIGNLCEWYNFLLFGFLMPFISQNFFPSSNKFIALTFVFTVFAVSFLVRPIGGLFFGWIGDVYGRQRALVLSMVLMAIPTFLIGCLPTYQQIGILSPILLCILRILQGLSVGGEHTGSAVYLAEHAPKNRRSLWVSTVPSSAALGLLVSSSASLLVISAFSPDNLLTWGWRIAYWSGALLCVVGILLRIGLPETPHFQNINNKKKLADDYSFMQFIKDQTKFKKLILVFCLASGWGVFYQILYVWMPTYLTHINHFSSRSALQINTVYLSVFAVLILCVGFIADFINKKALILTACFGFILLAYPLFLLLSSNLLWKIYLAMGIFTVIFSFYLPAAFICMVEIFHVEERYTGMSFGFNSGLALFGGTCPLISTWLIKLTSNPAAPAYYMIIAATLTAICCKSIRIEDSSGS